MEIHKPTTNAHTHLELTGLVHLYMTGSERLETWMGQVLRHRRELSKTQIYTAIQQGIKELKTAGTTHVGDISATWLSVEPLVESGLKGIVYLEVRGLNRKQALEKLEAAKKYIDQMRRERGSSPMQVGLSLHSPYTCHPDLLKKGAALCASENIPLCIHVAESPDESRLIRWALMKAAAKNSGVIPKLAGILKPFQPQFSPVFYLDSLGVLKSNPLLVHCIHLKNVDIRRIVDAGCSVVHCPRSNERLSCGRMPLERFLSARTSVYLGTDSRASSPSLDVREEVDFASKLHGRWVDSDKIEKMIHAPFP
jgi:aminodeoxyfutalosine deaminase